MTLKAALLLTTLIGANTLASLLAKIGATRGREDAAQTHFNRYTLGAIAMFGLAFLVYSWSLRLVPLNVAQSVASIQFVSIILVSAFVLSEPMPPMRILGCAIIAIGVLLVTTTFHE